MSNGNSQASDFVRTVQVPGNRGPSSTVKRRQAFQNKKSAEPHGPPRDCWMAGQGMRVQWWQAMRLSAAAPQNFQRDGPSRTGHRNHPRDAGATAGYLGQTGFRRRHGYGGQAKSVAVSRTNLIRFKVGRVQVRDKPIGRENTKKASKMRFCKWLQISRI